MTTLTARRAGLALAAAATLALSACGSDTLDTGAGAATSAGGGGGTQAAAPTATLDQALADKVPAKFKGKTLIIGTDASYAPNEFTDADGKTIIGLDIDLMTAVVTKLGIKPQFTNAGFDSLILGVTSGKYGAGVSSFTINADRMKQVNMVSYFNAGTLWATSKGNPRNVDPENACGLSVGVQKGTIQVDDLTARSKKCTADGKPAINLVVQTEQSAVTASLVSGKVVAMAADSPVTNYAVGRSNGAIEPVGSIYDSAPYGLVLAKGDTELAALFKEALESLKKDGTYEAILSKWNNASGAISAFEVNPSAS